MSFMTAEYLILMIVATLKIEKEEAYGVSIQRKFEAATGAELNLGKLYVTLDELETKGFITSESVAGGPERGGHPKRIVTITDDGIRAINDYSRQLSTALIALSLDLLRT
jgi:PadR family transcriptional regulator PadR